MGSLFVAILIVIILISFFYKNNTNYEKEEKEKETLRKLEARYQNALRSGDRATAIKCGRDYYAYLRNSRSLSAADEQALARDVAKMSSGT
jgi:uncharacterized membrane protein (DUF106 family)